MAHRCKDCGSYILIPVVLVLVGIAVVAVLTRASQQQQQQDENGYEENGYDENEYRIWQRRTSRSLDSLERYPDPVILLSFKILCGACTCMVCLLSNRGHNNFLRYARMWRPIASVGKTKIQTTRGGRQDWRFIKRSIVQKNVRLASS